MELRRARALLLAPGSVALLLGCTTVGTGTRTIVKYSCAAPGAPPACGFLAGELPLYVTTAAGADRVLHVPARHRVRAGRDATRARGLFTQYQAYLTRVYGSATYEPLELGFTSRDRTRTPPYAQNDFRALLLARILAEKSKASTPQEIEQIKIQLGYLPDLVPQTAHYQTVGGARLFRYYPRLSFDFSVALRGLVPPDRLASLHFLVRLRTTAPAGSDPIRFLDFSPKDADLVAFTRGQITQAVQATLSATQAEQRARQLVTTDQAAGTSLTEGGTGALTQGPLSIGASETLVRQLADAIERRSAGLIENGRTFFASFRGLRDVKLAGTYNFDVMLEVPSTLQAHAKFNASVPVRGRIEADVFLVAVVRHVNKRGRSGLLTKAPENENDDTFDQVVVSVLPAQLLWMHGPGDDDWVDAVATQPKPTCKLTVVTTQERGSFVVERGSTVLATGRGLSTELELPTDAAGATTCTVSVDFLRIVDLTDGQVNELEATDVSATVLSTTLPSRIVGEYKPTS